MDWNDASPRGQRIWVRVRQGSQRMDPRVQAPLHVRLVRLLLTLVLLGALVLFGALALGVGLIVAAVIAVVVLARRGWRALVGGFESGGEADRGRRNVRVIQRPR